MRFPAPFTAKSPAEIIDIGFDLTNLIAALNTISTATIAVTIETGTAAANTLVLVGSPTIVGKTVLQRISQGVAGNTYLLTLTATESNGEIYSEANCITVENKKC